MTKEEFEKTLDLFGDTSFVWGATREEIAIKGHSDEKADELIKFADFAAKKKAELMMAFDKLSSMPKPMEAAQ